MGKSLLKILKSKNDQKYRKMSLFPKKEHENITKKFFFQNSSCFLSGLIIKLITAALDHTAGDNALLKALGSYNDGRYA